MTSIYDTPDLSIVVPCYHSGEWIGELVDEICFVLETTSLSYEIVLVDDGSLDGTWDAIRGIAIHVPVVRGIRLLSNVGQFRATMCGLKACRGNLIVTMDDDFQHDPHDIPVLLKHYDPTAIDCVVGAFERKQHSWLRNLGSRLYAVTARWCYRSPCNLRLSAFRLMNRVTADAIASHDTMRPIIGALLLQTTKRIINAPIHHHERRQGPSGYSFAKLVQTVIDNTVAASTAPLKAAAFVGLLSFLGSLLLAAFYIIRFVVSGSGVPGFTTLAVLTAFFGGACLAAIGILGEYVARIVHEAGGAPQFTIREAIDGSDESQVSNGQTMRRNDDALADVMPSVTTGR